MIASVIAAQGLNTDRMAVAAAFVVTLLDPWALLQPGFWLSFVAVALLMSSSPAASSWSASAA